MNVLSTVVGIAFMIVCGSVEAGLLDDENDLGQTIQDYRCRRCRSSEEPGINPAVEEINLEPDF